MLAAARCCALLRAAARRGAPLLPLLPLLPPPLPPLPLLPPLPTHPALHPNDPLSPALTLVSLTSQYVELPDMAAERAVQSLNHRHMGTRYVEVFLSSEGEMNQANVAPATPTGGHGAWGAMGMGDLGSNGIVRLRGLPFNTTAEMILAFFQGYDAPKGLHGVHLILGPNGRPNGEAFVEFASEEVADAALNKDRATIGTRYVEVFRATPEQMMMALQRVGKSNNLAPGMHSMHPSAMAQHAAAAHMGGPYGYAPYGMPQMGYMGGMPGSDSVVKMRGLPYKVTRNDILDFFSGFSVPLNGVHLIFNEREQPTGEAYVEFSSADDRERAMSKDRQHIGGRYVELFRVSELHVDRHVMICLACTCSPRRRVLTGTSSSSASRAASSSRRSSSLWAATWPTWPSWRPMAWARRPRTAWAHTACMGLRMARRPTATAPWAARTGACSSTWAWAWAARTCQAARPRKARPSGCAASPSAQRSRT